MIQIIPFGRTLPTEFTQYVNQSSTTKLEDANLGDIVVGKFGAWRYVRAGSSALNQFEAIQASPTILTADADTANVSSSGAQGDTRITIAPQNTTAITVNAYRGGVLQIYEGGHAGAQYPIAANTAKGNTAADTFVVTIAQKLQASLDSDSSVRLFSDFADDVVQGTNSANVYMGQAMTAIAANAYGWLQFAGLAQFESDAIAAGDTDKPLIKAANGRLTEYDGGAEPRKVVGYCVLTSAHTAGQVYPVMLEAYGTF